MSASISVRSDCKNDRVKVGDSCILKRAADSSSIHAGKKASELSVCKTTAISTWFVTSRRRTMIVWPNCGWNR
jgi:hypothetical protein